MEVGSHSRQEIPCHCQSRGSAGYRHPVERLAGLDEVTVDRKPPPPGGGSFFAPPAQVIPPAFLPPSSCRCPRFPRHISHFSLASPPPLAYPEPQSSWGGIFRAYPFAIARDANETTTAGVSLVRGASLAFERCQ